LVLVGSDVVGRSADRRRRRDSAAYEQKLAAELAAQLEPRANQTAAGSEGPPSYRQARQARKRAAEALPAAPGWATPAAATLAPLVRCLEAAGFALAHRELIFPDSNQRDAPPPAAHAATCTFVRQ
jgi:hypothetical protein